VGVFLALDIVLLNRQNERERERERHGESERVREREREKRHGTEIKQMMGVGWALGGGQREGWEEGTRTCGVVPPPLPAQGPEGELCLLYSLSALVFIKLWGQMWSDAPWPCYGKEVFLCMHAIGDWGGGGAGRAGPTPLWGHNFVSVPHAHSLAP